MEGAERSATVRLGRAQSQSGGDLTLGTRERQDAAQGRPVVQAVNLRSEGPPGGQPLLLLGTTDSLYILVSETVEGKGAADHQLTPRMPGAWTGSFSQ